MQERTYSIKNLNEIVDKTYNMTVKKGVLKESFGISLYKKLDGLKSQPIAFYNFFDTLFLFLQDGFLYRYKEDDLNCLTEIRFTKAPSSIMLKINGKNHLVLSDGENSYAYNGEGFIPFYVGFDDVCAYHKERLFLGKCNRLLYSAPFNVENFKENVGGGYIDFYNEGDIKDIVSFKDNLYVFLDSATYCVSTPLNDEKFTVKQILTPFERVVKGSIKKVGEALLLMADGVVYSFDGNFKALSTNLLENDCSLDNLRFSSFENKYVLQTYVKPLKEVITLIIDGKSGETLINNFPNTVIVENGLFYQTTTKKLGRLQKGGGLFGGTKTMFYKSLPIEVEREKEVSLNKLNLTVEGDVTLRIKTATRTKIYSLSYGEKSLLIDLLANAFVLEVMSFCNDFKVKDIKIKYVL